LNGFEQQMEEEIDGGAVEAFWAFVSGGSPLLSAFEWTVTLQRLCQLADAADFCACAVGVAAAENDVV
jgi:hypothetical protein